MGCCLWLIGIIGLMGLLSLTGCSDDSEAELARTTVELVPCAPSFVEEELIPTRSWTPPTGYKLYENLNNMFSRADTAKINKELLTSLKKNNRLEIYNHSFFRTAYILNNIHPEGVRVGVGMFGVVYPTVLYKDLLLNVGPMQKKYKDGVIRTGTINTHDLGTNPAVKPYHYQGDPDQ